MLREVETIGLDTVTFRVPGHPFTTIVLFCPVLELS